MIASILTVLPLLTPLFQGPLPADRGEQEVRESYSDLLAAYKKASLEWRREQRAAKKADEPFEAPHPIHAFYGRFAELADAGDGRAVLWLGLNVQDTGRTPGEVKAVKRSAFDRLTDEFVGEALVEDLVKKATKQGDWLTDAEMLGYLEKIHAGNADADLRAATAYKIAELHLGTDTDAGLAAGEEWLEKVVADHADSKYAKRARQKLDGMKIVVGKIAPDFEAEDVDGNAFKLSDYRGKVVVLDFWGFW
jgi:hypothetical protein